MKDLIAVITSFMNYMALQYARAVAQKICKVAGSQGPHRLLSFIGQSNPDRFYDVIQMYIDIYSKSKMMMQDIQ